MTNIIDGNTPRNGGEPTLDDTAYLLNCYDVWSATPLGRVACHGDTTANGADSPAE